MFFTLVALLFGEDEEEFGDEGVDVVEGGETNEARLLILLLALLISWTLDR